jgi:hypothetical protein
MNLPQQQFFYMQISIVLSLGLSSFAAQELVPQYS